jgi:predicted GNAT family N-acyltransferase
MHISVHGFHADNVDLFQKSLDLRQNIFVEELKFDKFLEFDGLDENAMHYLLFFDDIAVGIARWIDDDDKLRIDRFGIQREFRNRGLGLLLIKYIKREVSPVKKTIDLLATNDSVLFFIQQGFKDSSQFVSFGGKKVRVLML